MFRKTLLAADLMCGDPGAIVETVVGPDGLFSLHQHPFPIHDPF